MKVRFEEMCSDNIEYCHMAEGRLEVEYLENN
jgi:hypothetical protein